MLVRSLVFVSAVLSVTVTYAQKPPTTLEIAKAFKKAGLDSEGWKTLSRRDIGMAPYVHTDATRFIIPLITKLNKDQLLKDQSKDVGGRIFKVASSKDREALADYYRKLGKANAMFYSHVWTKGLYVLQINGDLPDDIALKYKKVFDKAIP